jgi:hypothetical protein
MKILKTIAKQEWGFSTWFVFMSPLLGVLLGFLSLFIFAR